MKILLADDHKVLREGLKQILSDEFPGAEFGEAGTTRETLDCLSREAWDVLILDFFMPGRSGLEVLAEVTEHFPLLPVLVLSSAPEQQLGLRVLKAGASGYLNKQTAAEHLVTALKNVLSGKKYVSEGMAQRLAADAGRAHRLPHEALSDREFQVMHLVIAGRTLKEIAADLSLSAKTISTFHTRIWQKLGVRNDVELVRYAVEHQLFEHTPGDSAKRAPL